MQLLCGVNDKDGAESSGGRGVRKVMSTAIDNIESSIGQYAQSGRLH
jgi:hypothetical protein